MGSEDGISFGKLYSIARQAVGLGMDRLLLKRMVKAYISLLPEGPST